MPISNMIKSYQDYYNEFQGNAKLAWQAIRRDLRTTQAMNDSNRLFSYTVRRMHWYLNETGSIDWVDGLYRELVSESVNNPRSRFFIYG